MKSLDEQLASQLLDYLASRELLADVESIYADIERLTHVRQARCRACGACCRFAEFGHRLFVTTPELICFLAGISDGSADRDWLLDRIGQSGDGQRCPFQVGQRCGIRAIRPAGCRLFFCGSDTAKWVQPAYEQAHARLRAACQTRSAPYAYVEWLEALKTLPIASL